MISESLLPLRKTLECGAEIIYSIPTSGYGHASDEQPLPYIKYKGFDLSPRFGGDEANLDSGYHSLPLPSGKIASPWPIRQAFFNLFRRRVNIYWRNVFESFNKHKPFFMFSRQLDFYGIENGFIGKSPVINFERRFRFSFNEVEVLDKIEFKNDLRFDFFDYAHYAQLKKVLGSVEVFCDKSSNIREKMSSSTGEFYLNSCRVENVFFKKGDFLFSKVVYRVLV